MCCCFHALGVRSKRVPRSANGTGDHLSQHPRFSQASPNKAAFSVVLSSLSRRGRGPRGARLPGCPRQARGSANLANSKRGTRRASHSFAQARKICFLHATILCSQYRAFPPHLAANLVLRTCLACSGASESFPGGLRKTADTGRAQRLTKGRSLPGEGSLPSGCSNMEQHPRFSLRLVVIHPLTLQREQWKGNGNQASEQRRDELAPSKE